MKLRRWIQVEMSFSSLRCTCIKVFLKSWVACFAKVKWTFLYIRFANLSCSFWSIKSTLMKKSGILKFFQRHWTTVSLIDRVYKFCFLFFFCLKLHKGLQFLTNKVHFFKRSRASERCRSWVLWKSVTFSIKLIWMFVWNELTKILFFDSFCVCAWLLRSEMPNIRVLFPLELKYYTAKLIHTERKH